MELRPGPGQKKGSLGTWSRLPPSLRFPSIFARNHRTEKITTRANLRRFFMAQNNKFAVLHKSHKTLNFRGFLREAGATAVRLLRRWQIRT